MKDLINLAKECPTLQISVTLGDLLEAGDVLTRNIIDGLKPTVGSDVKEPDDVRILSSREVTKMLGVSQPTLWRWQKSGYLVPLNVGGLRRYRLSDVNRILGGDNAQKGVSA